MKTKVTHIIYMVAAVALMSSCKPQVPSQYIQPDDMEDLIFDYHLAQGIADQQEEGGNDYNRRLTFEMVLKDHGVTQAEFDSSLVYYYNRADRFQEIYKHVQARLNKEAEKYGAALSELQNLSANSLSGDTVDVWKGKRVFMLLNDRPYHLYTFSQPADTSFHAGDSFMMSINSTWLMQNGNRQATAYILITYANDSTYKTYTTLSVTGTSTLRIPYCKLPVKEIKGFVMCGMRPNTDNSNNLCLLFINNIQLARFRNKVVEETAETEQSKADSIPTLKPDSAQYDSLRRPAHIPGNRPITMGEMNKMRQMQMKKDLKPISK